MGESKVQGLESKVESRGLGNEMGGLRFKVYGLGSKV